MNTQSVADIRTDYKQHTLNESDVLPNPIEQFGVWFEEALRAEVIEPNAMTLATVDDTGQPSARIMLLKGFTNNGFVFYTNYESRKGKALDVQPRAALVFFWPELERQVRIEGRIGKVSQHESNEYFQSRPFESRVGAWVSKQSTTIESRLTLEQRFAELMEQYHDGNVPLPPFWGGFLLQPTRIEFWQGRPSRLHDRILYTLENGEWQRSRLSP